MKPPNSSKHDDREWQAWLDLVDLVANDTNADKPETAKQQKTRIKRLLKPENFEPFCKYYFPHYIDSCFGWFHLMAAAEILNNQDIFAVLEWAREHAKSVFADVFIPMWMLATGQLTGMILASETAAKADVLIGDLEAELRANKRFAKDFGEMRVSGSWASGHFKCNGIGVWAFGIGQNPAGVRVGANRPNLGIVDDAANMRRAKNQALVKEDLRWVLGEFMGCLSIKGKRFIYANNRTAANDLTAHVVGDIEQGDAKREGIKHIKVFATEIPDTHELLMAADGGVPAWRERYTIDHITTRHSQMGYREGMRQFYHLDIKDGDVFTEEMLPWVKCLPLDQYDALIAYCDPSFTNSKKSDFKAIVLVGRKGKHYHIIWVWDRQAKISSMVNSHYDLREILTGKDSVPEINLGNNEAACRHYIEANFMQYLLLQEYEDEGEVRGYQLRIRGDKRKKPPKDLRIESLTALGDRGLMGFNESYKCNADMKVLRDQFLAFPNGPDDGPDATESAISLLDKKGGKKGGKKKPKAQMGVYKQNMDRAA